MTFELSEDDLLTEQGMDTLLTWRRNKVGYYISTSVLSVMILTLAILSLYSLHHLESNSLY